MGFIGDWISGVTLGLVDLNGEDASVESSASSELEEDKKEALKKRKALYETSGGVLGQDVSNVGTSGRGSIFGN